MLRRSDSVLPLILTLLLGASALSGQNAPPGAPPAPVAGRGGGGRSAYPQRPTVDPAVIERGRGVFSVNCAFCHGSDARGGEGGPNLLRSSLVLNDQKGELIAPVVRDGRPNAGMPPVNLTAAQISDMAAFLHSFPVGGRDAARSTPPTIVVGDAAAGKAQFQTRCAACHSESGDLKGLASRQADPKTLQQLWLMPGGGRGGRGAAPTKTPITVTVTLPDGAKAEGRLERIDDFLVVLRDSDGRVRSFPRKGDRPAVAIHDPLKGHLDLLPRLTDKDIHDLTAYLVTLK
ncbi:MAG: c-type cytochrome [Candidatus Solibacter sp.]